ncbi:MAG: hypothetical protein IPK89_11280 [Sphingomonadales bacterium]|nr:hypothetical protein [Sphingomonadales bacterium]
MKASIIALISTLAAAAPVQAQQTGEAKGWTPEITVTGTPKSITSRLR